MIENTVKSSTSSLKKTWKLSLECQFRKAFTVIKTLLWFIEVEKYCPDTHDTLCVLPDFSSGITDSWQLKHDRISLAFWGEKLVPVVEIHVPAICLFILILDFGGQQLCITLQGAERDSRLIESHIGATGCDQHHYFWTFSCASSCCLMV